MPDSSVALEDQQQHEETRQQGDQGGKGDRRFHPASQDDPGTRHHERRG